MDKKRSYLNVTTSMISRLLLLVAALYVRRLLIRYLGNGINGLNSLYVSIIGMLSVVELGIGSAIVYSMYKPILLGDERKVASLYNLYRKVYLIIGTVIFGAGLLVMRFLPLIIRDYADIRVNVYSSFFLILVSVVFSYFYIAKTSLIEAYKNNYITTIILTISRLLRYGLQAAAILLWKSYAAFLICQIIETLIIWGLTEIVVWLKYRNITTIHEDIAPDTKSEIVRNVKAMFMHKFGTILVNTIDSIIISAFVGVVILGKYTNYTLIAGVLSGTISLFFTPLTSIIGHLCAAGDPDKTEHYFNHFYTLNYILGFITFLGYYAVADETVALCFGTRLKVSQSIVFTITLNQFTSFMRRTPLLFRDASGTFYYDRWKPVAEGIANLLLSLFFVRIFPEQYQVVGVIVATIITTLLICNIIEPYVVYHHVFDKTPKVFYIRSNSYIFLFSTTLVAMTWIKKTYISNITGILVNGTIAVTVSLTVLGILMILDRGFRKEVRMFVRRQ